MAQTENRACTFSGWEVQDSDEDLLTSVFPSTSTSTPEKMTAPPCTLTPEGALEAFQEANRQDDKPRERFFVNRLEGSEELKKDILSLYKDPRKNLRAAPRVRFEGEEAVGAGPVREFFHCALKIIEELRECMVMGDLFYSLKEKVIICFPFTTRSFSKWEHLPALAG